MHAWLRLDGIKAYPRSYIFGPLTKSNSGGHVLGKTQVPQRLEIKPKKSI